MTAKTPTLGDLRKAGTVTSSEIVAAIDAYVRDPMSGPYRFASGHSLDIAAALAGSSEATERMARPGPKANAIRSAVTAAAMTAPLTPP